VRAPVGSRQPQSTDVSLRVQAALTHACALLCAHFLASFLRFWCLNVTTLFNIDVKNTFSCRRCQLLCCYSAPLLWPIYLHATRVPGISVCIFSCNCTVRRATTELCNFDAKQSTLCCSDGFCTLYCCVNTCLFS